MKTKNPKKNPTENQTKKKTTGFGSDIDLNKSETKTVPPVIEKDASKIEQQKVLEENREKKTRGKYKTRTSKKSEKELHQKELSQGISKLGEVAVSMVIDRLFPKQPLTDIEKAMLNDSVEKFIFKYANYLEKYGEEVMLFSVLSIVFVPRYVTQKKENEKKKPEKPKDETS